MVQIRNKGNNEVYNLHGANIEYATKDSVIVNRVVGNTFRKNWHGIFDYYMPMTSCTQCLLADNFEVLNTK